MSHIKFYHITEAYVEYLRPCAPHLFYNRQEEGTVSYTHLTLPTT